MEDKERVILTIFGIVAIIAIVGVIGIFNKPTYIIIPSQNFEEEKTPETQSSSITGMATATYSLSREQCLRYKSIYSRYGWFDDWQWFKDNCDSKYDLSEPKSCKERYLDEYKCDELDYLQRKWQRSNCETGWRYFQYCKYGCSDGKCKTSLSTCTAKYLYDYRCYGGNSQRVYQKTDCTTYYREYEVCKKGCNQKTGRCNKDFEQKCDGGYLDEYRCSGNYLQRIYQYSNCVKVYRNYRFCNNGCSNNKCN